ncbi:M14 family metallopeptidase [Runella slithyformis]|uniref:Peptidase M14 carboxypeptidase A n=1 Tax=Runella slithyformis (strain ATCC 29530 / DSM 19594 / LMG 11500 / NCIMB 11436 / LSU 4) TaxID=761193 RepID=A0A7U4E6Q7_RUNSL|nr:M14 family metallopeptidase [Runella slithyformis]AEI49513.1 peptidase M14 carboxypeptidase A [Runella slithyformis DSM 19594]
MIRQLLYGGVLVLACVAQTLEAQTTYNSHAQLSGRLKTLTAKYGALASVSSIGKSAGGRDLWLLTLGKGDAAKKPAILVVAGLDGTHLAGSELAVQTAEKMLGAANADSIARLLDTKTFYFLPSMNPDAQEQFSAKLKYERTTNDAKTDDDRDGRLDEDPFEDLNGDGVATWIRVEDAAGTYVLSKEDPRILVKADPAKGESGKYLVYTEGIDNDKDGAYNEDGAGGVNPEKNFTFDYQIFTTGSGEYAAEAPEVRALLDFLYRAPNIFAVLTFGPNNNLSEAPRFDASKVARRILTGPLAKDAKAMDQVSKLYNTRTALKDAPAMPQTRGNFSQTAYFHAGRYSFTTPGWWVPKADTPRDTTRRAATAPATPSSTTPVAPTGGGGRMGGMMGGGAAAPTASAVSAGEDDARFLKWADKEKLTGVYVDWKAVQHPDFPGQKVEVGGIVPFAKLNPPVSYLASAADKHVKFLAGLGAQMPEIQLVNVKTETLGNGLTRVTATVVNKGLLPTYAEIGDRVRFVQKVKTELKLGAGQAIVSGKRLNLRAALASDESEEYTWLVSGTGKLTIEAGCPTAGVKSADVTLK